MDNDIANALNWRSLRWQNGCMYEGLEAGGACESHGVVTWPDRRERYEGQLRGSKPHGFGAYRWRDGTLYRGEWYEGDMQGCGVLIWKDEQGSIQAKAGKFFGDGYVGPVPGCSTEAAHEAALEADVAAGRARKFETQLPRRQGALASTPNPTNALPQSSKATSQPGRSGGAQTAVSAVNTDGGGGSSSSRVADGGGVRPRWPWVSMILGSSGSGSGGGGGGGGGGGWAARAVERAAEVAGRCDHPSRRSSSSGNSSNCSRMLGVGVGIVGSCAPWDAIRRLHLEETRCRASVISLGGGGRDNGNGGGGGNWIDLGPFSRIGSSSRDGTNDGLNRERRGPRVGTGTGQEAGGLGGSGDGGGGDGSGKDDGNGGSSSSSSSSGKGDLGVVGGDVSKLTVEQRRRLERLLAAELLPGLKGPS